MKEKIEPTYHRSFRVQFEAIKIQNILDETPDTIDVLEVRVEDQTMIFVRQAVAKYITTELDPAIVYGDRRYMGSLFIQAIPTEFFREGGASKYATSTERSAWRMVSMTAPHTYEDIRELARLAKETHFAKLRIRVRGD